MASSSREPGWGAKAVAAFREGGLRLVLVKALQKTVAPLAQFGSVVFFARDLAAEIPPAKDLPEFRVCEASLQDLSLVLEACVPERSEQALRRRMEGGDRCFIAIGPDHRAAHSRWLVTEGSRVIPELDLRLLLRPGEAYTYDTYTRPELRIRGVDGLVRRHVFQHLRESGFKRVYSYVRSDNPAGLNATRRWQQRVARIWYVRLRGSRAVASRRSNPGLPLLREVEPEDCAAALRIAPNARTRSGPPIA